MKHEALIIRAVLQDLRDMETKEDIEKMHLCNLPTASDGFAALDRIEARAAELEQEVADHLSIEKGHLHLIAELKSQLKLKP